MLRVAQLTNKIETPHCLIANLARSLWGPHLGLLTCKGFGIAPHIHPL